MSRVLVVDDHTHMREALKDLLSAAGHAVSCAASADEASELMRTAGFDCVLTDLKMPGRSGLELLAESCTASPDTPVIVLTAHATVESAVEAMKRGAFDYIKKPFDPEEVELVVERAIQQARLVRENEGLRVELRDATGEPQIIGESRRMKALLGQIDRMAASDATVLVRGETGTGKELVARAIHARSPRSDRPFLALNCAALSAGLLESELFGHEKGAFTGATETRRGRFELAEGGTLLLDEVSEIDRALQAKLLRVLQERSFERVGSSVVRQADVRVVATTNRRIEDAVAAGDFREDLYFRLNVLPVEIPPLRERRGDVALLAKHFAAGSAARRGVPAPEIEEGALSVFQAYGWPGNVREMENVIERAFVMGGGAAITAEMIEPWLGPGRPSETVGIEAGRSLVEVEKDLIIATLRKFGGHRAKTAETLGISRRTLTDKIGAYRKESPELMAEIAPRRGS